MFCLGSGNPASHAKTNENPYREPYVGAGLNTGDSQSSANHEGKNRGGQTAGGHSEGNGANVEGSKHTTMLA